MSSIINGIVILQGDCRDKSKIRSSNNKNFTPFIKINKSFETENLYRNISTNAFLISAVNFFI